MLWSTTNAKKIYCSEHLLPVVSVRGIYFIFFLRMFFKNEIKNLKMYFYFIYTDRILETRNWFPRLVGCWARCCRNIITRRFFFFLLAVVLFFLFFFVVSFEKIHTHQLSKQEPYKISIFVTGKNQNKMARRKKGKGINIFCHQLSLEICCPLLSHLSHRVIEGSIN